MNKMISISGERNTIIRDIIEKLLKEDKISAVLSLRKLKNGTIDYGLTTKVEYLGIVEPFYPLMPVNAGQQLSSFTPLSKPIAAIVKPCEFRAFVEMVKREQGLMKNFLIFTYSCSGVYPIKANIDQSAESKLEEYQTAAANLTIPEGVRDACRSCEHIHPMEADIFVSIAGEKDNNLKLYLQTEQAETMLKGYEMTEGSFDDEKLNKLLDERKIAKEEIFAAVDTSESGLDGLIDIFGKCVGCHGCNSVCPICYCVLCDFDSFNYDYNRPILEKELEQKGALRLPPDTLFFHLGRLSHMSFSCVGCGMCSDVCPANIPVAAVFKRTGENTAAMFDFVAGRSVKEEIPVMIYKEEEFPELGE